MKIRFVWVVEMNCFPDGGWEPTVGVGLNRIDGRNTLKDWKKRNPSDKFRLRQYGYAETERIGNPPVYDQQTTRG